MRPRLVGFGDSSGNRRRVPSESGNMAVGLQEYRAAAELVAKI